MKIVITKYCCVQKNKKPLQNIVKEIKIKIKKITQKKTKNKKNKSLKSLSYNRINM